MDNKELLNVLNTIKPCLSSDGMIPITTHFCFDEDSVFSFNGVTTSCLYYESDLCCGIPGNLLLSFLNSYSSNKNISIEQNKNDILIKAGSSKTKLTALPSADFCTVFDDKSTEITRFSLCSDFITGIDKCLLSVDDSFEDVYSQGISIIADEKGIALYSKGIAYFSKYEVSVSLEIEPFKVVLPKLFCVEMVKWFKKFGIGMLIISKNSVCVKWDDGFLHSTLCDIPGKFCDFEKVVEIYVNKDHKLITIPKEFGDVVKRSLLLSKKENLKEIHISLKNSLLEFKTVNDFGQVQDVCDFPNDNVSLEFKMDTVLLKKAISLVKKIGFSKSGSGDGVVFVGKDEQYLHILLSLRI